MTSIGEHLFSSSFVSATAVLTCLISCHSKGRSQPDLVLIGFSVDTPSAAPPNPSSSQQNLPPPTQLRPTTPSASTQPQRIPAPRQQNSYPDPRQQAQQQSSYSRPDHNQQPQPILRPSSAASTSTTSSRHGPGGSNLLSTSQSSSQFYQPPQPQAPPGRISPAPPPNLHSHPPIPPNSYPIDRPPSSASTRSQHQPLPPQPQQQRKGSYPDPRSATPDSVRSRIDPREMERVPAPPQPRRQPTLPSEPAPGPPTSLSASKPPVVGMGIQFTPQQSGRDGERPPTSSSSSSTRPPAASTSNGRSTSPTNARSTTVVAPTPRRQATLADESNLIDESTILSNVEEMLEGFEWRGSVGHYSGDGGSGSGGGGFGKGRKADEIEKRLIGELKALEAVSSDCSPSRLLSFPCLTERSLSTG